MSYISMKFWWLYNTTNLISMTSLFLWFSVAFKYFKILFPWHMISITFHIYLFNLSRFLPKIFPGYPQAWNACYRNIKRHFLFLSSQECCSQQLNTWKTACGAPRDRCGVFQAVFPKQASYRAPRAHAVFQSLFNQTAISVSYRFFFLDSFSGQLAVMYELSVLETNACNDAMICIAGIHTYIQHNHNKPIRVQPVSVPVLRGQRGTLDVQGEEIGSGEEWRGEKEGEMKGWFRNSVHLYLRGWEPAPAGCLRERWCPRCWSYHPPRPACAPAGHTHIPQTQSGAVS